MHPMHNPPSPSCSPPPPPIPQVTAQVPALVSPQLVYNQVSPYGAWYLQVQVRERRCDTAGPSVEDLQARVCFFCRPGFV